MVELVIKIDENVFTRLFDNGIQDNEIAIDDICEMARALRMGTPLEEEFKRIKADVYNLTPFELIHKARVLNLLDNHISELKGENNG